MILRHTAHMLPLRGTKRAPVPESHLSVNRPSLNQPKHVDSQGSVSTGSPHTPVPPPSDDTLPSSSPNRIAACIPAVATGCIPLLCSIHASIASVPV